MAHSTCIKLGRVGFFFAVLSPVAFVLRHRSQSRPGLAIAAHLIGALEVGFLVLLWLAWPKC